MKTGPNRSKGLRGCLLALCLFLAAWMLWSVRPCPAATGDGFTYPAEWAAHDAMWIGFRTLAEGNGHDLLLQQVVKSLAPHVRVKVIVEEESLLPEGKAYFSALGLNPADFDLVTQKPTHFWFRDPGPLFLVNHTGQLAVGDFQNSNYANVAPVNFSPLALAYEKIDETVARQLGLATVPSRAVLEGGAFEVNGQGTILLSAVTAERNPGLTRGDLEAEILGTLGQRKIVWLKDGMAEDPSGFSRITGDYWGVGTGGHTDEFVRFVDGRTLLLAWPSAEDLAGGNPLARINARRMAENQALLRQATDQDGRPFEVVHFPVPDLLIKPYRIPEQEIAVFRRQNPLLKTGDRVLLTATTSYLNYVMTNDVILLPAYWQEGRPLSTRRKDRQARAIMARFFPERKIIQLDPTTLNFMGGGMHCITQQQPAATPH